MSTNPNPLSCIVCSTPLGIAPFEGEQVQTCPRGHGMWLDDRQLAALTRGSDDHAADQQEVEALDSSAVDSAALTSERFRSCPVCQKTLRKDIWRRASGVVIDVCDEHGTWLTREELQRAEAWSEGMEHDWQRLTAGAANQGQ